MLGVLSFSARSARAQGFYIGEMTDYSKSCVDAEQLDPVTISMANNLRARGWGGIRYTNGNVWPPQIVEGCSSTYGANGKDHAYGDLFRLLVIAGHGNTGLLGFGDPYNAMCSVHLGKGASDETGVARLGQMNGGQATIAIWLTCCTLRKESLSKSANYQWLKQQIGFHGESNFDDDMVGAFTRNAGAAARVGVISNVSSWGTAMEDKPGWFQGDNSTIVVSYGSTSAETSSNHSNLTLNSGAANWTPRGGGPACGASPPRFYYKYTIKDHGAEGCN